MKLSFLFVPILLFIIMNDSIGQSSVLETSINQMYLNVYTDSPEQNVKKFMDKYVPSFYRNKTQGGWVAYPDTIPIFTLEVHSLIFEKHPFFDGKYNYGVFTIKTKSENDSASLRDVQVFFCYDSESKALDDYNKLFNKFNQFENEHFVTNEGLKRVEFNFSTIKKVKKKVTIALTHDILSGEYKITFLDGEVSYRMKK